MYVYVYNFIISIYNFIISIYNIIYINIYIYNIISAYVCHIIVKHIKISLYVSVFECKSDCECMHVCMFYVFMNSISTYINSKTFRNQIIFIKFLIKLKLKVKFCH